MKSFISIITTNIKRNKNTVVFSFAVLILGLILGAVLRVGDSLECLYNDYLSNYLTLVFSKEYSPLKLLFERMFNSCLILFLVALCSLNKFSFFLNYFILFYRAFMLGLAGKLFITGAFISGFFTFTFLILVQALFLILSIIVFMVIVYGRNNCTNKITLINVLKTYLFSLIIAGIGAILECFFIVFLFRTITIYF